MSRKKILDLFLQSRKVCTDTRKIEKESLFFALKGANFNGNTYAKKALDEGCSFAIIDEPEFEIEGKTILVDDVLESLQFLASDYRDTLKIPIIGISGSNGKTTTKELIRDVLAKKFSVFATHGNLNNHIGVPLSLLTISKDTDIAIIEMGANHTKEIAFLCEIAKPDFGLLTNIGKAHLEGFGGIEGVIEGKGELFAYLRENVGHVFVNQDSDYLDSMSGGISKTNYNSQGGKFNIQLTQSTPTVTFEWSSGNNRYNVPTNFTGVYNLHNMAAAIVIGTHFKVNPKDISEALSQYEPENNRSQIIKTDKNTLIMDAYNANPTSIENALENLSQMDSKDKFFVLGDMLELGDHSRAEHQNIVDLAEKLGLKGIYVGSHFQSLADLQDKSFENSDAAMLYLEKLNLKNTTVLIKGSRGIKLEVLTKVL